VNEENINKLFEELATKANSEDAVNKAEVETLRGEIADLREQMARKSQTKSHTAETNAQDDDRLAKLAFVKGRYAIEDGDVKATEFSRLVGEEGGNTVPTVFDGEITRGLAKLSPIRSLSRVVSVKANLERIIKMRVGGAAKTKAEKAAYTLNTTDLFGKLSWGTSEIVDQQRHTSWVSDDQESILNLAAELQDSMILNIAEKESDLFLNGTQTNTVQDVPGLTTTRMGLLAQTALTSGVNKYTDVFGQLATVQAVVPATGNYLSDAVLKLRSTLHSNYLQGAVLVFSSDVELALFMEKDENGRSLLRPADASIAGGFAGTVHNMPYVIDDSMPTIADALQDGTPAVLLADFRKAYTIVDFGAMKWVVDPITEPQYVKYSARRRVGGAIVDYKAIRALELVTA
jgi:HK97 family phage major capsid protein